jgi:hypothetical protein
LHNEGLISARNKSFRETRAQLTINSVEMKIKQQFATSVMESMEPADGGRLDFFIFPSGGDQT